MLKPFKHTSKKVQIYTGTHHLFTRSSLNASFLYLGHSAAVSTFLTIKQTLADWPESEQHSYKLIMWLKSQNRFEWNLLVTNCTYAKTQIITQ